MTKYPFDGVVFDLDGVITQTANVHAGAWKKTFDEYMLLRQKRDNEPFKEFTHDDDYLPYVDGKPRYDGVKSFLESRGINLSWGDPNDAPDKETVCGIGNKKNAMFNEVLKAEGAEVYQSTVDFIQKLKQCGVHIGVASSSKNCKSILESAGIENLFETRVDGVVSAETGLKGKPEGDIFVTAARNMGVAPATSVVVEDATSGVQAGRNGGFGLVLGVARKDNEDDLIKNGADVVVRDLADINIEWISKWFEKPPELLLEAWDKPLNTAKALLDSAVSSGKIIANNYFLRTSKDALFNSKKLVFFLDYDGTLTPIVDKPELAILSEEMRSVVKELSEKHTVAIVSGRMREDVENLVKIDGLFYAGSHGFDIVGPGFSMINPKVKEIVPLVTSIIEQLKEKLGDIPGLLVEEKKFSTAVHYRLVDEDKYLSKIKEVVEKVVEDNDALRLMSGKKVFEILPNIEWNKGMAIRWIMDAMKITWEDSTVVYIGDDTTDEFAFRVVRTRGTGILVAENNKPSAADFGLASSDEVKKLFENVIRFS